MTNLDEILALPPYKLSESNKKKHLIPLLNDLQKHHYENCKPYKKMMDLLYPRIRHFASIESFPYMPINVFKDLSLASIPEKDYFKTIFSSGTTNSSPSRIILDATTAHNQTEALASIMRSFLGEKRLPMLIIDCPDATANPSMSARAAGIIGMSHFGRDHCYALNNQMELDLPKVNEWLKKYDRAPFFIFGFTFMIWQFLIQSPKKRGLDLSHGILFHGGGWKKLEAEKISNSAFKKTLKKDFGLAKCHSFYGMVEQIGSIFVECEKGHLHAPNFADIIIRDPNTWKSATIGSQGVAQVISLIPTSYPGHSLLTEDLGCIHGIDDCSCGRKGKYFWIDGRVPQSAPRGCGDTFTLRDKE